MKLIVSFRWLATFRYTWYWLNGEEPIGFQFLQTIKNKGSRKKIRTLVSVRVLMSIFQWLYNFLVTAIPFSWFSLITFFLLISFAPSVKLLWTACYINYPFNLRWKICYKDSIASSSYLKLADYVDKSFFILSQQTERRCHNIVATSEDWLHQRCQFVGKKTFADVNWQHCGKAEEWHCSNVLATLQKRIFAQCFTTSF